MNLPVILIPSLEPDQQLPPYVRSLLEHGFSRVIVVDDGSGEAYQPIFAELDAIDGCTVLHHEVNRGKGAALRTGCKYILENVPECESVLTADADGQHTLTDCKRVAEALAKDPTKLYLGSRDFTLPNIPPKSRFGNRCTSVVFKLTHGVWLPDTQTGLRAFSRDKLPFMLDVPGDRYEYEMNMLIACAHHHIPIVPITIETVYENNNEGTHFHPLRDSWRIYKVILGSFIRFAGSSLFCFVIGQLLAGLLRDNVLPGLGMAAGSLLNVNISGYGARVVSSIINYLINRKLVFKDKGSAKRSALRYAVLSLGIITLSNLGVWLLMKLGMTGWLGWLAKIICDLLLYFVSYRVQQQWVFAEE